MRKLYLILAAAAVLASCQKQAEIVFPEEGTVNREPSDVEITVSNPDGYQWKEGDSLNVFSLLAKDSLYTFHFKEQTEKGGVFSGNMVASETVGVVYPWSATNSLYIDGNQFLFDVNIPSMQTDGQFNGAGIAVGSRNSVLTFKNVCTKVKFSLSTSTGTADIVSVGIAGLSKEDITGKVTVLAYAGSDPILMQPKGATGSSVVYSKNLTLSDVPTDVEFFVAPQTFSAGYKVSVTTTEATVIDTKIEEAAAFQPGKTNEFTCEISSGPSYPDYFIEYTAPAALKKASACTDASVMVTYDAASGTGKMYFESSAVPAALLEGNTTVTSVNIPSNITGIGATAFKNCSALTSVTWSAGSHCEYIETQGLQATGMLSLTLPASLKRTDKGACNNNKSLTHLGWEEGSVMQTIGENSFNGCSEIKDPITIPATVTSIVKGAFNTKYTILAVYHFLNPTPVTYAQNMFAAAYISAIYVPAASVDAYKAAWTAVASVIEGE